MKFKKMEDVMGIFSLIEKAVGAIPVVVDLLDKYGGESDSSSNTTTTDPYELIEECEEYLDSLSKFNVDDLDDFLNCLTKFERKWLKLDTIDSSTDDQSITQELFRLDQEKENIITKMENDFDDLLNKIDIECKAETDPEKWQILTEKWYKYFNNKNRILDHRLQFTEKLSKQAN